MNQILFDKDNRKINYNHKSVSSMKIVFFKFILWLSLLLGIGVLLYYFYYLYQLNSKEQLSHKIKDNLGIASLYSGIDTSYTSKKLTLNDYVTEDSQFSVIGLIEIPKININYPIISYINDELLKIAPCRFFGPLPNEVGNLCIAAHNYNNYKFFSKLKNLKIGDRIFLYDLSKNKLEYIVYDVYDTDYNDLSCTSQDTNGKKEITLITCHNIKSKRTIIKAKERE